MVKYLNNKTNGFQQFSEMKQSEPKKGGMGLLGWMLIVLVVYWIFMPGKKVEKPVEVEKNEQINMSAVPKKTVKDDKLSATVQGLRISNVSLSGYDVSLLDKDKEFIEVGLVANDTEVPLANTVWKNDSWRSVSGVEFNRKVSADNYTITVADNIHNNSKKPIMVSQYSRVVRLGGDASRFAVKVGGIANINSSVKNFSWKDITSDNPIYETSGKSFVGFTDQYWETIVSPTQGGDKTIKMKPRGEKLFQAEIAPDFLQIDAGKTATIETKIYAGPKTQHDLRDAGKEISEIDRTIDYGWFAILSRPFLWALNGLHDLIPNYGIAIILLTIIIRGLMWPLSKKSYKSMAAMQKMQPEMQRIQKLYANDKVRLQQEIMRLYQTHKTNPLSSVGMMFFQIPIFFALYKALLIAVPLRHAGFLWLHDLSVMDPYFILPVLMALSMWYQNKISGSNRGDVPGASFMKYLPIIFGIMFAWMPSGLVLYWTVSNLVGIIQMKIMRR